MSKFRVVVCSLPSHEELVAEIYIGDVFFGLISQEEVGGDVMFEPDEAIAQHKIQANILVSAISSAVEQLKKLDQKGPDCEMS